MNARKTVTLLSAAAALAAAAPAYAYRTADESWRLRTFEPRRVAVAHRPVVVQRTVVVRRPAIVRPVLVARPAYSSYYRPAYFGGHRTYSNYWGYGAYPHYYSTPGYRVHHDSAVTTIGGALIGGLIGSQVTHGHDQAAGAIFGALIGGLIGSNVR